METHQSRPRPAMAPVSGTDWGRWTETHRVARQLKVQAANIADSTAPGLFQTRRHWRRTHGLFSSLRFDATHVQHVLACVRVESDVYDPEPIQLSVRTNCVGVGIAQVVRYTEARLASVGGQCLWRSGWLMREYKKWLIHLPWQAIRIPLRNLLSNAVLHHLSGVLAIPTSTTGSGWTITSKPALGMALELLDTAPVGAAPKTV